MGHIYKSYCSHMPKNNMDLPIIDAERQSNAHVRCFDVMSKVTFCGQTFQYYEFFPSPKCKNSWTYLCKLTLTSLYVQHVRKNCTQINHYWLHWCCIFLINMLIGSLIFRFTQNNVTNRTLCVEDIAEGPRSRSALSSAAIFKKLQSMGQNLLDTYIFN